MIILSTAAHPPPRPSHHSPQHGFPPHQHQNPHIHSKNPPPFILLRRSNQAKNPRIGWNGNRDKAIKKARILLSRYSQNQHKSAIAKKPPTV
ncbi:hypothetical protein K458DRAFT_422633 [Lentithecium fluviatile CBS 122367]|uniref:Uncharacterized protein n=1 Tax=Lentithecium fluviatile CBS 122367 TaxID=1168545 RepID=A0A6G1ILZ9_9PLEO|nr:hypothetical protein K458DRAFT_422633 [Lentithecium fluviatile CBS 122367]